MAESKRRGEDAVDERLDEGLDGDAPRDDALDERLDKTASKPERASGVDKSTRTPAKTKAGERPGVFARFRNFLREIISELGKVIWPTRKELLTYTTVVVVFVAIMMTIVGVLDFGFAKAVIYVFGSKGK
ncbi:preprotein translocase subunit SecE [Planosporangium flavigriseum]|uniref:Protein translocase subunit SecE n=1 Tax=Planosporangium flavigriseum TaxID=373681 RepID=A0A8J3PM85_9ACTN|nr:preprotein translocase subunit SecE [Planosporangium flavigriseum]NJC64744.1 preprotein translocase subunit SecE [Planosporangium flavigriseum]GIG74029.1 protein translocase subunit SecE [Planosporangium flavigriseum]